MITHSLTKYLLYILPILGALLMMCGCKNEDEPLPLPPPTQDSTRTILVYMVATNNLGGNNAFDSNDIKEMKSYMQHHRQDGQRLLVYHVANTGVVLKEIKDSTDTGVDTLKVYGSSSVSLTIERMRQVISDAKTLAPADSYGMVFWSHASGWLQDGISDPDDGRMRSFGIDNKKSMNITALATALENTYLDFIYFDCCYMGSVETMYELKDCAPYVVCSPAEIHSNGMPYHLTLKYLFDTSFPIENALVDAARTTFSSYDNVFQKGDCPNTMAVVRMEKMDALADITRKIYRNAEQTANPSYNYQRFSASRINYYYDLDQYVESLCTNNADLQSWKQAFSETVIYAEASPWIWSTYPVDHYCGLSTYIMDNLSGASAKGYNTLSWYADVASFLEK